MNTKFRKNSDEEAELDVTPFMNLMIVLVPVMLITMTFTQITVHEIKLPDLTQSESSAEENPPKLEVLLSTEGIKVFYPSNVQISDIPLRDAGEGQAYDFEQLSLVLQEVKNQLGDKRDLLLLSEKDVDYQSLVFAMDAVKSYQAVVAASVVEVELFPEVSLADASVK
ncbi:biopolymer transporter ExbD [Exilibacterium tricleocarpae]|uniref:Biopolymer transporter ExbD n=1 Tax=Exilibacterium tricleocarpae TaxID=2591008 RepID=A0A545TAG3_9GAMM|nr:biopolymer transporter ExbD [Exilibacterium tricleocarpae]TQV74213.1 biopolymer transporter ExbD [Exilibacterium tricleocarpae]